MNIRKRIDKETHLVEIEGVTFRALIGEEINPGDSYIAERNTGPRLLTCSRKDERGWVVPVEQFEYCYDFSECVKVELA